MKHPNPVELNKLYGILYELNRIKADMEVTRDKFATEPGLRILTSDAYHALVIAQDKVNRVIDMLR